jgi:hypothetical protein
LFLKNLLSVNFRFFSKINIFFTWFSVLSWKKLHSFKFLFVEKNWKTVVFFSEHVGLFSYKNLFQILFHKFYIYIISNNKKIILQKKTLLEGHQIRWHSLMMFSRWWYSANGFQPLPGHFCWAGSKFICRTHFHVGELEGVGLLWVLNCLSTPPFQRAYFTRLPFIIATLHSKALEIRF